VETSVILVLFLFPFAGLQSFAPGVTGNMPATIALNPSSGDSLSSTVTAAATAILAIGIFMTAYQIWLSRKFLRVTESNHLLNEFEQNELRSASFRLQNVDHGPAKLEELRERADRVYARAKRLQRFKGFKRMWQSFDTRIQLMTQVTDRIEIYLRNGTADEGLVAQNIGHHIIVSYYILQNILERRSLEKGYVYGSYRDLAMRMQDYGKLYRRKTELREDVSWAPLPPFKNSRERHHARPYLPWWAVIRKLRLLVQYARRQLHVW
jgi:hypothetical protein